MKRACACLLAALAVSSAAQGAVRRALIVGIDQDLDATGPSAYQPSSQTQIRLRSIHGQPSRSAPPPLDGSVNDAEGIRDLLVTRFGFEASDVIVLKNGEATADRILGLLQTHLIDAAQPGDISFFFFAGHGSRIRNTSALNANASGYDSTIVPADAALGVPDIRGKELAKIYVQAPAKGVSLTVILDSCYSGAASRGALSTRKVRSQPADAEISVDETLKGPLPEDRGVLFISAAQDYEPAAELEDTDLNGSHGAFTWALLHVLGASAADDGVDRIFQRVRALMQSKVSGQEPVLLARTGRNQGGLFGQAANLHQAATVAVARVAGPAIRLNGGLAMNLHDGCELKRVSPPKPEVEIRVTKVNGLATSDAVISGGSEDPTVRPGDLFEIVKWSAPDRELMRVWEGAAVPAGELRRMSAIAGELRKQPSIHWVEDPSADPPTHVLSWDAGTSHWSLRENHAGAKTTEITRLSVREIAGRLPGKTARLFVNAGPSAELLLGLRFENTAIRPIETVETADYALIGRFCGADCIEYAWVNPAASADQKSAPGPLRTDWFQAQHAAAKLNSSALELARIVGWLELAAPSFDSEWPYRLALQNVETKQIISSSEVRIGERYKLMLRAAPDALHAGIPSRRVYVFAVDSFGETQLLFGDNLENEFPRLGQNPPQILPLTTAVFDFEVGLPYGVDNFFLLASAKPIDNPETAFNSKAVRTRSAAQTSPLARLLEQTTLGTRGPVSGVPTDWSIEHLSLLAVRGAAK